MPNHIEFAGIAEPKSADMVFGLGDLPGICVIECTPQNAPSGEGMLLLFDGSRSVGFPGSKIVHTSVRVDPHGRRLPTMVVKVADRRHKWAGGNIVGDYNTRNTDGTVRDDDRKKNARELAGILLDSMGETTRDVSALPTNIYPRAAWPDRNTARLLRELCLRVGCDIAFNTSANVKLVQLGVGTALPSNNREITPRVNGVPRWLPNKLIALGSPLVVQGKLKLEAVGLDTDGKIKLINDLSYKPSGGWEKEWHVGFPSLTDPEERYLATLSVDRWFRLKGQADGTLEVPGIDDADGNPVTIETVHQYHLLDYLIEAGKDIDEVNLPLPPYVVGKFWKRGDDAETTAAGDRYPGRFKYLKEERVVAFETPVWQIDGTTRQFKAAEMYLFTAYQVSTAEGELVRYRRELPLSAGNDELALEIPELFYSLRHEYSGSGNNIVNTVSTQGPIDGEADAWLAKFQTQYQNSPPALDITYSGIEVIAADGLVPQVHWRMPLGEGPTTRACQRGTADPYSQLDLRDLKRTVAELSLGK